MSEQFKKGDRIKMVMRKCYPYGNCVEIVKEGTFIRYAKSTIYGDNNLAIVRFDKNRANSRVMVKDLIRI